MTEKCTQCGAELHENAVFCIECGARRPEQTEAPVVQEMPVEKAAAVQEVPAEETPVAEVPAVEDPVAEAAAEEQPTIEEILDQSAAEEVEAPTEPEEPVEPSKPGADAAEDETEVKPAKKARKKVKWWMIALPVVLVLAIAVAFLWKPLMFRLAPQLVLVNAFNNTSEALTKRSEDTALTAMSKAYDDTGKNTANVSMVFQGGALGDMQMDLTMQSDLYGKQNMTSVGLAYAEYHMNFHMYANEEFAAVNMDVLTGDTYLGFAYDTFSHDIRNNPYLMELLGEESVDALELVLDYLDAAMSIDYIPADTPRPELQYEQIFSDFLSENEPEIGEEEIELDRRDRNCYTLAYHLTEAELGALMEELIPEITKDPVMEQLYLENYATSAVLSGMEPDWEAFMDECLEEAKRLQEEGEGEITLVFYLYDDQIAQIGVNYVNESDDQNTNVDVVLTFGMDAATSDILLSVTAKQDEEEVALNMQMVTTKEETVVSEQMIIEVETNGSGGEVSIGYTWNRENGDYVVSFLAEGDGISPIELQLDCVLTAQENGFTIEIPDVAAFVNSIVPEGEQLPNFDCSVTYSIHTGAEISEPEYVDITTLNEDDILKFFMNFYEEFEL